MREKNRLNGFGFDTDINALPSSVMFGDYDNTVRESISELRDHVDMNDEHLKEVAQYLKENEEIADQPGLLLAAASTPLMEMGQIQYRQFRVVNMGDAILVEREHEDGWEPAATVPEDLAILIAQGRAQRRSRDLKLEHDDLREEVREQAEEVVEQALEQYDRSDDRADAIDSLNVGAPPPSSIATSTTATPPKSAFTDGTKSVKDLVERDD